MNAVICAVLGGIAFFFSMGLGEAWPTAWVATAPLLWLAYGDEKWWQVAPASFVAFAAGQLSLLQAYGDVLPATTLAMAVLVPAVVFAAAVLCARFAARRLPPALAVFAFPALWTSISFLDSLTSPNGTFGSFAYSQIGAPVVIQGASLFGLSVVTFLLCLFASALALVLREGKRAWAAGAIALLLFGVNAAYGVARLNAPVHDTVRAGIAANDQVEFADKTEAVLALTNAYADAARELAQKGARVVVEPEKIGVLTPDNRKKISDILSRVARETGTTIVIGYEERADEKRNIALIFTPDGKAMSYYKRHMVPGLERLVPGTQSGFLGAGRSVAICKDMDFPRTISADAQAHVALMYVPAWDFGADAWTHARMAIMRGVENGFAIVRAAKDGLLTASDAEGRVIARAPSSAAGMVTLLADVPLGSGDTLYLRIGDVFAWGCLALLLGLTLASVLWKKPKR